MLSDAYKKYFPKWPREPVAIFNEPDGKVSADQIECFCHLRRHEIVLSTRLALGENASTLCDEEVFRLWRRKIREDDLAAISAD